MRDDPRQKTRGWQAPLEVRTDPIECLPGFQPSHCIHFFPAVPITALAIAKELSLVAVGCIYGFAVIDYMKNETIYVHCTFDQETEDINSMSRMQSIRRSFRQSLQRMNIRRSMRGTQSINRSYRPQDGPLRRSGSARPSFFNRTTSIRRTSGNINATANTKGKSSDKGANNVAAAAPAPLKRDSVRTIFFTAPTNMESSSLVHGMVVGTNQGAVLGYTIEMPKQRNNRSPILMPIEKEFNQRKNQSVLFVGVIDGANYLLEVNDEGSYRQRGLHYLIMCTEDMLRVISLPNSRKKYRIKFKQNEAEEMHAISAHYMRISGQSVMVVMDNEGNISIFSLPELQLLHKENCVDAADAVGQRHFLCSSLGIVMHQKSPAEFTRASLTELARLDLRFSLPAKGTSPQTPPRFSRPLSDGPHLVELQEPAHAEENDVVDELGPVESQTSMETRSSRKSTSGESRKSMELPDHYYTNHNPELREDFNERAL
jgi:hypothetical protein